MTIQFMIFLTLILSGACPEFAIMLFMCMIFIFGYFAYKEIEKDNKLHQEYLNKIKSGMTQKEYNDYKWTSKGK